MKFIEKLKVKEVIGVSKRPVCKGAPPISMDSNVTLRLINKSGDVVEERDSHNIFLDYGREWLAELVSLDTGYVSYRSDRIRYMAFGIGGTEQTDGSAAIRATWDGYPNHWGYGTPGDKTTGGYGNDGTSGTGDPTQADTDPTITGLEYPVQATSEDYYDDILAPVTFPEAGTARYTSVLGYDQISYPGGPASVPLSEIGLFTSSVVSQDNPPLDATISVSPLPALGVRYMMAYNTFPTLHKTSSFVLQIDWELRFS